MNYTSEYYIGGGGGHRVLQELGGVTHTNNFYKTIYASKGQIFTMPSQDFTIASAASACAWLAGY